MLMLPVRSELHLWLETYHWRCALADRSSAERCVCCHRHAVCFVLISCISDKESVTAAIEMDAVSALRAASQVHVTKTLVLTNAKGPTELIACSRRDITRNKLILAYSTMQIRYLTSERSAYSPRRTFYVAVILYVVF